MTPNRPRRTAPAPVSKAVRPVVETPPLRWPGLRPPRGMRKLASKPCGAGTRRHLSDAHRPTRPTTPTLLRSHGRPEPKQAHR